MVERILGSLLAVDEPVKRIYSSPLRQEQARRTRRRMVEAARSSFLARGYAATTVPAVARAAGVSADTVFHVFGTKRDLLRATLDVVVGGDDEDVALLDRPDPQRLRTEPDPVTQLRLLAAGIAGQMARVAPMDAVLRGAAAVDPEVAALRADVQDRQRREVMATVVGWVAAHGPLLLPEADAATAVWALTSPEVHDLLVARSGWDDERYRTWLGDTLVRTLLGPGVLSPPGPA